MGISISISIWFPATFLWIFPSKVVSALLLCTKVYYISNRKLEIIVIPEAHYVAFWYASLAINAPQRVMKRSCRVCILQSMWTQLPFWNDILEGFLVTWVTQKEHGLVCWYQYASCSNGVDRNYNIIAVILWIDSFEVKRRYNTDFNCETNECWYIIKGSK